MRVSGVVRDQLAARFEVLLPHLNERQQRLALATEARLLGHGGVRAVAEVAGVSVTTVRKGVFELEGGEDPLPSERGAPFWWGSQERRCAGSGVGGGVVGAGRAGRTRGSDVAVAVDD